MEANIFAFLDILIILCHFSFCTKFEILSFFSKIYISVYIGALCVHEYTYVV